jgi:Mce-associated membrane protein
MEGDAGTSRLNPTDPPEGAEPTSDDLTAESEETADLEPAGERDDVATESQAEAVADAESLPDDRPSRLSRGWFAAIFVVLLVLAAGVVTGGFFALRAHDGDVASAKAEQEAIAAAKVCVAATNAPDSAAMAASVQKIIDCSTGDFGAYAKMMAPMMVEAYQAANVKVEVTNMRAAVERQNDDGTIDVLVAFRFRVPSNPDTQNQETGLRLRALMAPDDGRYKIAKLDPVMT